MKMFFTLEYYMDCRGFTEINFYFLSAEHEPITLLRMDRYFDPVDDDPLEYLQSYSDTDELKAFWTQFSKDELLELLETEGITKYFEFHESITHTKVLPITSPKSSIKALNGLELNLGSLV